MHGRELRRGVQIIAMICMVLGVARLWVGCAPQERYHVLTVFFDGVPDPNAPPKPKRGRGNMVNMGVEVRQATTAVGITTRHKPFVANQCASCHPMNWGAGNGEMAYPIAELCVKCHPKVPKQYVRMHGPVAVKACDWCHKPHEAGEAFLLKAPPRQVCGQCHESKLLSLSPKEHIDGVTSCLDCHSGHGGPKRFFLHPPPTTTQAGTQPATQPATPATSQPASQPVPAAKELL